MRKKPPELKAGVLLQAARFCNIQGPPQDSSFFVFGITPWEFIWVLTYLSTFPDKTGLF